MNASMNLAQNLEPLPDVARSDFCQSSLPARLHSCAERMPDQIGLVDRPAERGVSRAFPFGQVEAWVATVSARLTSVGLLPGSRIAIWMESNRAEALVACLAALRARHVAMAVPVFAARYDLVRFFVSTEPDGLIVLGDPEPRLLNDALSVAGDVRSLRFIFSFLGASDGVTPLPSSEHVMVPGVSEPVTGLAQTPGLDEMATLHWVPSVNAYSPLMRPHRVWDRAGRTVVETTGLGKGAHIVCPFHALGYVGLSSAVVPWLQVEGTLQLADGIGELNGSDLAAHCDVIILPYVVVQSLKNQRAGLIGARQRLIRVHSTFQAFLPAPSPLQGFDQFDLLLVDDIAHMMFSADTVSNTENHTVSTGDGTLVLSEDGGRLRLSGPLVHGVRIGERWGLGDVCSSLTCAISLDEDAQSGGSLHLKDETGRWRIGGMMVFAEQIEAILRECPGFSDVAVYVTPQPEGVPKVWAIVVAKKDEKFLELADLVSLFRKKGVNTLQVPSVLLEINAIRRDNRGEVNRAELFERVIEEMGRPFDPEMEPSGDGLRYAPRQPMAIV